MPLVVPGINSSMGEKPEWVNKLMGKTIGDSSNETVCFPEAVVYIAFLPFHSPLQRKTFPNLTAF
jgi:hypothetical protein